MAQVGIVRALNAEGDWTFGGGKSNYVDKNTAVRQMIRCRLLEFTGNCFWNPQGGLDWPNLFGQKNQQVVALSVSSIILNTDSVTGIVPPLNVSLNRHTRGLSISGQVNTVYSLFSISLAVNVVGSSGG